MSTSYTVKTLTVRVIITLLLFQLRTCVSGSAHIYFDLSTTSLLSRIVSTSAAIQSYDCMIENECFQQTTQQVNRVHKSWGCEPESVIH